MDFVFSLLCVCVNKVTPNFFELPIRFKNWNVTNNKSLVVDVVDNYCNSDDKFRNKTNEFLQVIYLIWNIDKQSAEKLHFICL